MPANDVIVHATKLPPTVPIDDLLIRPVDGVTVGADPARAGWRYLSFRAQGLAAGETIGLAHPDFEAVVVTIGGGGIRVCVDGSADMALPGRESVFTGLPWAVYLPADCGARLIGAPSTPGGRAVIAYGQAPPSGRGGASAEPIVITPDDVEIEVRGAGRATRQVNNLVTPGFPADRLLVCEVFTPGGNWSGW